MTTKELLCYQGFFLTVSPETVVKIAEHSASAGKFMCLNLAAPFICEKFGDRISGVLGDVDALVGNDAVRIHALRLFTPFFLYFGHQMSI